MISLDKTMNGLQYQEGSGGGTIPGTVGGNNGGGISGTSNSGAMGVGIPQMSQEMSHGLPPHLSDEHLPNQHIPQPPVHLQQQSSQNALQPLSTINHVGNASGNHGHGNILKISNIPADLTQREATIIFSLVIDHIVKIELNTTDKVILAYFNNFNTCLTTLKLLNQKCIFGNDVPINVEMDESLNYEFNNMSLRNGSLNGSVSAPASAISIHPNNGTLSGVVPHSGPLSASTGAGANSNQSIVPPGSAGGIGGSSRSRFSFNDPFHEFDPNHPHESQPQPNQQPQQGPPQQQPNQQGPPQPPGPGPLDISDNAWNNNQNGSQPQTPLHNLNFDWNQSNPASLASKNSSNRRTSSAFFQSNFSNNLLSNSFINPNMNQGNMNQPLINQSIPLSQQLMNHQLVPGQPQPSQNQQNQSQPQQQQQQPQSNSQNGSISNPIPGKSNPTSSFPTPNLQQSSQVPNISPQMATSQLQTSQVSSASQTPSAQAQPLAQPQQSQQASQTQENQSQSQSSSTMTSPVDQTSNAARKDVPDLSLLARVPPPANPADQNPPCNTLYVGNLPPDATEQELRALFSPQKGFRRLSFRTKTNNNPGSSNHGPMCFVEFEDVAHATRALAELYGRILPRSTGSNGKGGIRLSFSKNPLGVRGPQRRSSSNQVNGNYNYNYHINQKP